jgi:hypothetical protein
MKTYLLISCFLVCHASPGMATPLREKKSPPFSLSYDGAGLTQITLKDGKLHFVWHTLRPWTDGQKARLRQSVGTYVRHKIVARLTEEEKDQFRAWISRHKTFDFPRTFPERIKGSKTKGSGSVCSLTLSQGKKSHRIEWNGDLLTPKSLITAVDDLVRLAKAVKDRATTTP